jgi:hypothetical protein
MKTRQTISTALIAGMLLFSIKSYGQFGIQAGVGISDIVFSDDGQGPYLGYEVNYLTHRYPSLSYQFGVLGTLSLNKRFEFQPELQVTKLGLNYNEDFLHGQIIYKIDIWYLELPLLLAYRFRLERKLQPTLFLGPYGSLTLAAKKRTDYDGHPQKENADNVKPVDLGLVFGFGFDVQMGSGQLITQLRGTYSLVDIMEPIEGHIPEYLAPVELKARNLALMVSVGYRFQFNRYKKSHK